MAPARTRLSSFLRRAVTYPTSRDKQRGIGPSEIAQKCDYCLGVALTRRYPEFADPEAPSRKHFSLSAWIGTAIHRQLEHAIPLAASDFHEDFTVLIEERVPVCELEGYGTVYGHIDLVVISGDGDYVCVVDHKSTDLEKLRGYQLHGVPMSYVFQLNLYAWGLEHYTTLVPKDVGIHFVPRDSNSPDDIWPCYSGYQPRIAAMAIERLERVWDEVRSGRIASLEKDADCFTCTWRIWT